MYNGYDFFFKTPFGLVTFPITPPSLKITSGSKNKVITLISEGDVNILKSPTLVEVEFEARFPIRKYPYSREVQGFQTYFDIFKKLKEEKKPFDFIVARATPARVPTWDTNMSVSLEEFSMNEDADNGDDILITFKLKQYKEYGVKTINTNISNTNVTSTSTAQVPRSTTSKDTSQQTYVVKTGDTLSLIAKRFYDDTSKWQVIYNANKSAIEADAKKHGKASSSNGAWIFEGLKLIIPSLETAKAQSVQSTKNDNKKYEITLNVTGNSAYIGSITLAYNVDKQGKREYITTVMSKTIKVDSGSNVSVTITPKGGHSFNVTASKPWVKSDATARIYTIPKVTSNSSISINWVR